MTTIQIQVPDQPKVINQLASGELLDLANNGAVLTLDDVVKLHLICDRLENPAAVSKLSAGVPVTVGGVVLWPFTIQGEQWYQACLAMMPKSATDLYMMAFAMAHGRTAGAFDSLRDPDAISKAVSSWSVNLTCTLEELTDAISLVIPQSMGYENEPGDDTEAAETSPDYAGMIADVTAHTGIPPDVWERLVCRDYLLVQMSKLCAIKQAEAGDNRPEPLEIEATKALGRTVKAIKDRPHGQ